VLEAEYGSNEFVVTQDDIADMVEALEAGLREGATYLPEAFECQYLKKRFVKRHPQLYQRMLRGEIPPPVTLRQFRYYTLLHEVRVDRDLLQNRKGTRRPSARPSVLRAFGPGSVYEIDATGGRVVLTTEGPRPVEIGTPWIYLVIDRWSRYVVSVHITLRPPSFAEVKHALLAMLTSRERFRLIGCNISDDEWPHGGPPAGLCCDRGAEFLSEAFECAVAERLQIPLDVLPPLTPDGKAIVERGIQTLKKRLSSKVKKSGGYMDRPTSSPRASKAFKNARKLAAHSLSEIYQSLIEVIRDYNGRPHTTLISYPQLAAHGIKPTPRDAFIFGQQQISGADVGTMSDQDFLVLLLDQDAAEGVDHCIRYQSEMYEPADPHAVRLAAAWRKKPIPVDIRQDELAREVLVWAGRRWAHFKLKTGAVAQSGRYTPEERKRLREIAGSTAVVCGHQSLVRRLRAADPPLARNSGAKRAPREEKLALRSQETDRVKLRSSGHSDPREGTAVDLASNSDRTNLAQKIDRDELDEQLAAIRKHRGLT